MSTDTDRADHTVRGRSGNGTHEPIATFFGGCVAKSRDDEELAYRAGRLLGSNGFRLQQGGYNGLMEDAARGAASAGACVVAVTMRHKEEEWGPFNPYITEAIYADEMGQRLRYLIDRSDLIVAMAGGIGSLHELTAALWYAGNVRRLPVLLLGRTAGRLLDFLLEDRWLYKSPTRPLDFLSCVQTVSELDTVLDSLAREVYVARRDADWSVTARIRQVAFVDGPYELVNGSVLSSYFDPFCLGADPALSADLAREMAALAPPQTDVVVGLAVGGVALATNLAAQLGLPLLVIRPRPKTYGAFAQLEGVIRPGQHALVVDDVIRSGRHVTKAARLLREAGLVVTDALCVVERVGAGRERLLDDGMTLTSMLTDEESAIEVRSVAQQRIGRPK